MEKQTPDVPSIFIPIDDNKTTTIEWLAGHIVAFHHDLFTQYHALYNNYTYSEETQQARSGFPDQYEYRWEGQECSGPAYIEYVDEWTCDIISENKLFGTQFKANSSKFLTRLVRIFAILILVGRRFIKKEDVDKRIDKIEDLFEQFVYFTSFWTLVDYNGKDAEPLRDVINSHQEKLQLHLEKMNFNQSLLLQKSTMLKQKFLHSHSDQNLYQSKYSSI